MYVHYIAKLYVFVEKMEHCQEIEKTIMTGHSNGHLNFRYCHRKLIFKTKFSLFQNLGKYTL